MKHQGIYYLLFASLGFMLSSCGNAEKQVDTTLNVHLYKVEAAGDGSAQEYPGRVKAAEEVNLGFKVSGTLARVYVGDGSKITKGQIIAEIDPRDYQIQFDATEAEYLKTKAEAERVMALYADSVVTSDAYDKARYGLRQITAKYNNAQNQLADTRIYAPFNGSVQKHLFDPPTVVGAGMPVVTLLSDGKQEVEINIPASVVTDDIAAATFYAKFDYLPSQKFKLTLISISPKANANQLYTIRLSLPDDIKPQPAPGMNTMVEMSTATAGSMVITIPATAIYNKDNKSCVWVYDAKNGCVNERSVTVSRLHTDGTAVITAGLDTGDVIVTDGVHKLKDKQKVKPLNDVSDTNVGGLL